MRAVGNLLWHFPFFGFLTALFNFILGGIMVLTVVGAPIGFGLMQFAKYLLAPYSNAMISKDDLEKHQEEVKPKSQGMKIFNTIVSICWIPFGVVSVFFAALQGIGACMTIVGAPVGIVVLKSLKFYLNPVNKICVPRAVGEELERREDKKTLEKFKLAS